MYSVMDKRENITTLIPQTLDELWKEAESLGAVDVDSAWGGGNYEVKIRFSRTSGTTVWAKGKNSNIAFALADAITEAREMGAG